MIVEWDPYSFSILAEEEGTVRFQDIIAEVTMIQEVDNVTFRSQPVIIESQDDRFEPRIEIQGSTGAEPSNLPHALTGASRGRGG